MSIAPRTSVVVAAALFLAQALACGDDGSGPDSQGPPPPTGSDEVAPQTITDLELAYRPGTKDVALAWSAPRDDDHTDHVARYDIRYSYSFPLDWDRSVAVTDPPVPETEGTPQSYALTDARRGRDLYVAARTYDAAGNPSAIGPLTYLYVPGLSFEAQCEDVLAAAPVAGLDALVTASEAWNLVTDANGQIRLDDIGGGALGIRIETGSAPIAYHTFEQTLTVADDIALSIPMIPAIPTDSPSFNSVLQLLLAALVSAGPGDILRRWDTYPIPWHADEFVNVNGIDYTALARQAAARWNQRTGLEIFVEVPATPAKGVSMLFQTRAQMGIQNGVTSRQNDADGYPLKDTIRIVDDFSDAAKLYSIIMHELGHTIRLDHLPAGFLMFGGQPLPGDVTDDEVRVVQMMLALPNGTDLARYDYLLPTR
ncbi:MAG TPA: hypothetical protein VFX92_03765 [Candidatus Krumholzibacteria bacterium]|nr:hypothetical protein [Candidatus Krumholzibacteria bacterium]